MLGGTSEILQKNSHILPLIYRSLQQIIKINYKGIESTYKMLITKAILVKFCTICMLGISELGPMFLCEIF